MSLEEWGWDAERAAQAGGLPEGWRVGRVVGQGRDLYNLADGEGTGLAAVSGAFRYRAALPADFPVTGDFVVFREEGDSRLIERVLPRRGVLVRKAVGPRAEAQVLAANLDGVFLVFALDGGRGFLPRLVERLLTLARESGAVPVVLLNKADLVEGPAVEGPAAAAGGAAGSREDYLEEARASAPGVEVLFTSAHTGENLDRLRALLEPGRTFLFLGKSGVGKSSLVNALFGREVMRTAEVREADQRGRHTTTSRDLFRLPGGALLIDVPGLREAALWGDEASVDEAFPEVASLAAGCRFRDCSHSGEPGCAVQQALVDGVLDPARYESFLDFRREVAYHRRLGDENAARKEKARWKKIGKLQKEIGREREKR